MRPIPSAVAAKTAPATTHPTYTSEVDEDFKKLPAPEKGDRTDAGLSEHEDDAIHQSPVELQKRIRQLERDASASNIKTKQSRSGGLFKTICSTDLLFLIDCTASMSGHIHAAKTQVIRIVDAVSEAFFGDAEIRISVVGYRDHKDRPNIQFLDFVHSAERVRTFLAGLKATGGGDLPEDVLGGIRQALGASWKHPTRTIIHIADAPPHGTVFHVTPTIDDDYPIPGTEPHRLTIGPLIQQMLALKINYALLRINGSTDRMALSIHDAYQHAGAQCKLYKRNKFFRQANDSSSESQTLVQNSQTGAHGGLIFEEAELGTTYNALEHLVVKNVTTSISRTICRVSASPIRATKFGLNKKLADLGSLDEDGITVDSTSMESAPPQWSSMDWFEKTLLVEGFAPDVTQQDGSGLDEMMASDDNIKMRIIDLTIRKRSRPFAQGAMRKAYYARTINSTNHFVVKSYKKDGKRLAHLAEDMRCQVLCKAFALEFNALADGERPIDFVVTTCFRDKRGKSSSNECMSLEPFIDGTYVKHTNNSSWINESMRKDPFNQAAQAFSHFTFERSQSRFLVSDLQGVGGLFTDPAIHTADRSRFRLAETNLGIDGAKFFFATHQCNDLCRKLKLQSNASMVRYGNYSFRQDWRSSAIATTFCCSNRLCGSIMRQEAAQHSEMYPGFRWCSSCLSQLNDTVVRLACVAPGAPHEFEASRFFHESQGQSTPRKCERHRHHTEEAASHKSSTISQSGLLKLFRFDGKTIDSNTIDERHEVDTDLAAYKASAVEDSSALDTRAEGSDHQVVVGRTATKRTLRSVWKRLSCF